MPSFLGPDYQILDGAILRQAAALNAPLLPWTVNDPATMGLLFAASRGDGAHHGPHGGRVADQDREMGP